MIDLAPPCGSIVFPSPSPGGIMFSTPTPSSYSLPSNPSTMELLLQCTSGIRDTLGQREASLISDCPLYQKSYLGLVVYEIAVVIPFLGWKNIKRVNDNRSKI